MKIENYSALYKDFAASVAGVDTIHQSQLNEALTIETDIRRKIEFELALLKGAPILPEGEGSRSRMIIVALQDEIFDSWPAEVQNQWFAYLQEEFFNSQSRS